MDALFGDYEAIRRSGLFDPEYYLATYPDVADRNLDPLVHYLEEGAQQGRNPHPDFDSIFYLEQCRDRGEQPQNPLIHYLRLGMARGFKTRREAAPAEAGARRPRTPAQAVRSPILVALEALGIEGLPDGGSRVSASGWALASAPVTEITVTLDGDLLATATYGLPRPDIARLYPAREGSASCGFLLVFDLPRLPTRAIEPLLTVRTAGDEIGQQPLQVEIPPQEFDVGIAAPQDRTRGGPASLHQLPLRLAIDAAGVDAGGILEVRGWAVAKVQIERVEVFIDGRRLGRAEFGAARDDIAAAHPDYPNSRFSGFALKTDIGDFGPGRKTVTVRAAARSDLVADAAAAVEVPRRRVDRKPGGPEPELRHHCDALRLTSEGHLVVKGWAIAAASIETLVVLVDGEEIGQAEIGIERPDIANLFPALRKARQSGFAFDARLGGPIAGEHQVTLLLVFEGGHVEELELPVTAVDARLARWAYFGMDPDRRLQVDTPEVVDGALPAPVVGNLEITGWALARAGVAAVEITIDGQPMAIADHGLRRLDIRAAFPDWEGSLGSGFSALLPHRILPSGTHTVTVTLRDKGGGTLGTEFRIDVEELPEAAGPWSLRRRMPHGEADLGRRLIERSGREPLFVAVLPVGGDRASLSGARMTIESLCRQVYPHWRLLVVPHGSGGRSGAALLAAMGPLSERGEVVRSVTAETLAGMAAATDASPHDLFLTVLTPDDELGCDAFLEMAVATALAADSDFLYSDERAVNPASGSVEAFFKPQWSPDLLASTNYIGRLWCVRADLLDRIGTMGEPLLGHGEYDLILRCTEAATAIRHVPRVLCERGDGAATSPKQSQTALERMLARRGVVGEVMLGMLPGTFRVKRTLTRPGLVSIVIPTRAAGGLIETCIDTLRRVTAYRNFEIVCIENIPPGDRKTRQWLRRNADRVISTTEKFNWSRVNNLAAAEAKGEYLLFLNDDIEITDPDWLDTLLAEAQRPEVGVVGPRLLYPDRRVQHAGMFLAAMGQGRHAFRYAGEDEPAYFGLARTQRNVMAVTGACLMTRRETFDALGGFDEAQAIINNDLDFCLRAWRSGLVNVYTPHAALVHHEAVSRADLADEYDAASFDGRWRDLFLAGDPFFNPHLSKHHDDFVVDREPTEMLVTGSPRLPRDEIRRILVVKLDHIGDCITAFPAIRRLKQHFPAAHITVLTSQASLPVWRLEPSVDKTLVFDFFHARSAFGELERSDEDWRELRDRLAPERFDLAIDLRKHAETRPTLQHTGARYLAGFDFRNQFPWLDVAIEWGGDQIYARKRQHTADDLVNLVDAVAAAGEPDRAVIAARPPSFVLPPALWPGRSATGPVVCVHPMAGNDMKQWPIANFAAVVDRLVDEADARVVIIGAPGEEPVAE